MPAMESMQVRISAKTSRGACNSSRAPGAAPNSFSSQKSSFASPGGSIAFRPSWHHANPCW